MKFIKKKFIIYKFKSDKKILQIQKSFIKLRKNKQKCKAYCTCGPVTY